MKLWFVIVGGVMEIVRAETEEDVKRVVGFVQDGTRKEPPIEEIKLDGPEEIVTSHF